MYPSVVWVMARGEPLKNPSLVLHAVCAYCVIRLFASTAATCAAKSMSSQNATNRDAFTDMDCVSTNLDEN
jgi:hypothetical protein